MPVHSYIAWESREAIPLPKHWPALIRLLGCDPLEDLSNPQGRAEALKRRSGLTNRQIAAELGIHRSTLVTWLLVPEGVLDANASSKVVKLRQMLEKHGL